MRYLKETDIDTLQDILEIAQKRYKDKTAVRALEDGEIKNYTYDDLNRRIEAYKVKIHKLNFSAGTKIIMIGDISLCWICCFFAITAMGLSAVPLDKSLSDKQVADIWTKSDAGAIILTEDNNARLQSIIDIEKSIVIKEKSYFTNITHEDIVQPVEIEKEQEAVMVYTSGTTGESKGVLLSHQNICHNVYCVSKLNDKVASAGRTTVCVLPTHHMFQITVGILVPIYTGMTLCIGAGPRMVIQALQTYQPDCLALVPAIIESLHKKLTDIGPEEFRKLVGKNLTFILSGGAALSPAVARDFKRAGIDIIVGYGITECSPVVATNTYRDPKFNTVGKALPPPYCRIKIIDGEICVKGSIVMKEYYKNEAGTREAFTDGWFRTGDLGEVNSEEEIILTGRSKNLIILSDGNNVSPEELENILNDMEYVDEVLVKEKAVDRKVLIAAEIFAKQPGDQVKQSILDQIDAYNRSVPMYKRIYDVIFRTGEFEKTSLGKIRRSER